MLQLTNSLSELSAGLAAGEFSSVEVTQFFLDRIEQFNPKLNCFISVTKQQALKQAQAADKRIKSGNNTALTGIPYAHKDIFCTREGLTTCGSKMLSNFVSPYDATVTQNLDKAGMVMLGKTNMDEFAMGSSNENSYYGAVRNPWALEYVPGGSSGGSAAAVTARIAPCATGTDTGGSIRQPAAFCGITGIKPTYGRVSRYGMVAYASSLDQGGVLSQSVEDCALVLTAMAGFDCKDSTSVDRAVPTYVDCLTDDIRGLKVGLPKQYFAAQMEPEVRTAMEAAIAELAQLGCELVDIDLPSLELAIPTYYIIASAECSSNLARYDGVRYGYRCQSPKDLNDLYSRTRAEGFGAEVKRRILIGTYVLSAGYYDTYYLKAQKMRRKIQQEFATIFNEVDVILGPVSPTPAFKIGEKINDAVKMYLSDVYTIAVNLAGLPALALPVGFSGKLPIGMQLIGNYFQEEQLFKIGHHYQKVADWHRQLPSLPEEK